MSPEYYFCFIKTSGLTLYPTVPLLITVYWKIKIVIKMFNLISFNFTLIENLKGKLAGYHMMQFIFSQGNHGNLPPDGFYSFSFFLFFFAQSTWVS